MSRYGSFAEFYDSLTTDVDYEKTAENICGIFAGNGIKNGILLDLACGTGKISAEMAKRGFDVIGIDNSPEMLDRARERVGEGGQDVLLLCQDMCDIDLYGTVDCAVCLLDSINHLESKDDLSDALRGVSLFMVNGGIFVFDVNTEYKHRRVLADNAFVFENDDVYCVWQNEYDEEDGSVGVYLDFFSPEGDVYKRSSEEFREYLYKHEDIKRLAENAGFEVLSCMDEDFVSAPTETSERVFYVLRKV